MGGHADAPGQTAVIEIPTPSPSELGGCCVAPQPQRTPSSHAPCAYHPHHPMDVVVAKSRALRLVVPDAWDLPGDAIGSPRASTGGMEARQ